MNPIQSLVQEKLDSFCRPGARRTIPFNESKFRSTIIEGPYRVRSRKATVSGAFVDASRASTRADDAGLEVLPQGSLWINLVALPRLLIFGELPKQRLLDTCRVDLESRLLPPGARFTSARVYQDTMSCTRARLGVSSLKFKT